MRWPMWTWLLVILVCIIMIVISLRTMWRKYQARWPWLVLTLNRSLSRKVN